MAALKWITLFAAIQLANACLFLVGLPVCALLAYTHWYHLGADRKYHWPAWAWIWDNEEDGVFADWYLKAHPERSEVTNAFIWTALRNSVNNLRYVPYISAKGRPLWLRNWTFRGKVFYAKAGWNASGFPVISAGAGQW